MRIVRHEEFRLLEVFKANAFDCRYWAENLSDFDYLRGHGLVTNGHGMQYGSIALTQKGLNYVSKVIERIQKAIS